MPKKTTEKSLFEEAVVRKHLKPRPARSDGLVFFTLSAHGRADRTELLTEPRASFRNTHRAVSGYPGRWEPDKRAREEDLTSQPSELLTYKEWSRRLDATRQRDSIVYYASQKPKEPIMGKDSKKAAKEETASERPQWNGKAMTAVIRWCGKKGFGRQQTEAIMKHCGFVAAPATIHIQLGKGRADENVPKFTKQEAEELKAVAAKVEVTPKKSKKDKAEKTEKTGKKSKKAAAAKDAEADADSDDEAEAETDDEEADDSDD